MSLKRGSHYNIGLNDPVIALKLLAEDAAFQALPSSQIQLVRHLLELTQLTGRDDVHINGLAKKSGLAVNSINIYSERLVKAGLLQKFKMDHTTQQKGRRSNIYYLRTLEDWLTGNREKYSNNTVSIGGGVAGGAQPDMFGRPEFKDEFQILPSVPFTTNIQPRAEVFSVFGLLGALRIANSGSRAFGGYDSCIYIGDGMMRVRVEAPQDQLIAGVRDTQPLIMLTTLASQFYTHNDLSEPLIINMSDFMRLLGLRDEGPRRHTVWTSLRSWLKTSFTITSASQEMVSYYGEELSRVKDLVFISDLDTLIESETGNPLQFAVHLNPWFINRVIHKERRSLLHVHREIFQIKRTSELHFVLWARRAIQYRTDMRMFGFDKLHKEMADYMEPRKFMDYISKLFIDPNNPGKLDFQYVCWKVALDKAITKDNYRELNFWIHADAKDRLVKQYSKHQGDA